MHSLAGCRAGVFLVICVLALSLLEIFLHWALEEAVKPKIKLLNYVKLLLLIYSHTSLSLPQTITNPDWDFGIWDE